MTIGYVGEQWRLGTVGRADRLDFQYSLNAKSLTDGTWVDVNAIDFASPITSGTLGILNGNLAANRTSLSTTISSLNIANGTTFWIRWNDLNATGADDGLAIDDFAFSAIGGSVTNTAPSITNNLGLSVVAGSTSNVISNARLSATDTQQTASQLTYTVTSLPAVGTLRINGATVVGDTTTFTQANIDANALTYDAPGSAASASFAFSVSDGLLSTSGTFSLTTTVASNTAPTITTPSNQVMPFQTATPAIAFMVSDAETAAGSLNVIASSSNTTLVPLSGIALGGSGASRNVVLTPANGQSGMTTITLSVSDGVLTTSTTFQLTVSAGTTTTSNLRIVSYNISGASSFGLRTGYQTLLQAMGLEIVSGVSKQVDLFALQEVIGPSTTTVIASTLNSLDGTVAYASGTLAGGTTGSGTQGVVYNTQTLQLVGEALVGTASTTGAPRQTVRHKFRPVGTTGSADFYVYNSHLKASDSSADANRRFLDVQDIRADADSLGQGANIIYVGDFNMFRSTEPGYVEYLSAGNGQAFDPINRPGSWSGNSSFRDIFTQAPSANAQSALGLDGGGMDDRLDFQLNSGELNDGSGLEYRPGSYHTFGVNSSIIVDGSIDDASNTALPGLSNRLQVLGLLRTVSDHLPVVADYTFVATSTNTSPTDISLAGNTVAENTSNGTIVGTFSTSDPNLGDTFTYTRVPGIGSTDNARFTLVGNSLRTNGPIDFEATPTLSIRIRSTDQGGLSVEKPFVINVTNLNDALVLNRKLFYNRSLSTFFGDGSGNPINAIDDSKVALLPGQLTSFANYTNVANGINGLIVDVDGRTTFSAADFQFATWDGIAGGGFVAATATPIVSAISGGGLGGSARIKIEFDNAAVRNTWLRVTVLANLNTDLASDDVFYFGNAVGDLGIGNVGDPILVRTNATDTSVVRQNQSTGLNSVGITSIYDFNKDGRVNATDTSIVRQNQASSIIQYFTSSSSFLAADSVPRIVSSTNNFSTALSELKTPNYAKETPVRLDITPSFGGVLSALPKRLEPAEVSKKPAKLGDSSADGLAAIDDYFAKFSQTI